MSHFAREIQSQPEVLQAVLDDGAIAEAATALRERPVKLILTLARGSSDNAVTFFTYLAGRHLGLPVASVPPSLLTVYASKLQADETLAVGVSQSGESSDVVEGLKVLAACGATTVAVSNVSDSALAHHAHHHLQQRAGLEQAVAASKTFSSQMMVLAALVAHWAQDDALLAALKRVPALMQELLENQDAIERAALRLTHASGVYVLGRGLSYGPALELALKLKETSYLHAQAYSSAEFQHGPIAAVDPNEPIVLLGLDDGTLESNRQVAERLDELGADMTVVGGAEALHGYANASIPLPAKLHPASEAFLHVLAGQLMALHLARSKGLDPDAPRHLSKVTRTL